MKPRVCLWIVTTACISFCTAFWCRWSFSLGRLDDWMSSSLICFEISFEVFVFSRLCWGNSCMGFESFVDFEVLGFVICLFSWFWSKGGMPRLFVGTFSCWFRHECCELPLIMLRCSPRNISSGSCGSKPFRYSARRFESRAVWLAVGRSWGWPLEPFLVEMRALCGWLDVVGSIAFEPGLCRARWLGTDGG